MADRKQAIVTRYANLSGNSGVAEYEIGNDYIKVRFRHEAAVYVYNDAAPGPAAVRRMQALAVQGQGLSTYISQYVGKNYARTE